MIGHEIGEVVSHHHNERITRQIGASGAQQILSGLAGARSGEGIGDAVGQSVSILAQTGLLLPGSRMQETVADEFGQQLMKRVSFGPEAAVAL